MRVRERERERERLSEKYLYEYVVCRVRPGRVESVVRLHCISLPGLSLLMRINLNQLLHSTFYYGVQAGAAGGFT